MFSDNIGIFELDYDFFRRRMDIIRDELMFKIWNPDNINYDD